MLDEASLEEIAAEARSYFLYEDAPDYLARLSEEIEKLQVAYNHPEQAENLSKTYQEVSRILHSLKGGAGMAHLSIVSELVHQLEEIGQALEQELVQDKTTALELLTLGTEEIRNLIDTEINGHSSGTEISTYVELQAGLSEFLATIKQSSPEFKSVKNPQEFIKIALTVDLEACLERLEKLLSPLTPIKTLQQGLTVLEEECILLGQALSFPGLVEIIKSSQQVRSLEEISLQELSILMIAEIRQLRSNFLENITNKNWTPSAQFRQILPIKSLVKFQESQQVGTSKSAHTAGSEVHLRIPIERLNRMSNTVSELLITHERLLVYENQLNQASKNLKKRTQELNPLREKVESFYDKLTVQNTQTLIEKNPACEIVVEEFDSLQFDQYTAVHSTLQRFQELMIQVQEIREDIELVRRDLQDSVVNIRYSLDSLHGDLTESRLVPFGTVAQRFLHPLQTLNQRHRKSVKLVIEGEKVLVDQAILEQLWTPLTHLIRNAFAHGIETPQERIAVKKSETGIIKLSAIVESNLVTIQILDDGRGINFNQVYQRAIALGLCSQETALNQLSETQLINFLFAPGFSTSSTLNTLSGRGLGLDIVRLQIEKLRGNIKIKTKLGKGTQFIIRIPLTLNILPLLLLRCQQQTLAMPSANIQGIVSLSELSNLEYNSEINQPITTILWQDQALSILQLYQILPYHQPDIFDYSLRQSLPKVGLVIQVDEQKFVIAIDEILGERELVVKPFDQTVILPPYLAGCTVLGTGEVVPILVPDYFTSLVTQTQAQIQQNSNSFPSSKLESPAILVIDDSIAVRRSLNKILTQAGYQVVECRDGKEAWNILSRNNIPFDLAICDLEMPGFDGFSLLQLIRSHSQWCSLPVIILTSRESQLHRQKATRLGANAYITKPFHPVALLDMISHYIEKFV